MLLILCSLLTRSAVVFGGYDLSVADGLMVLECFYRKLESKIIKFVFLLSVVPTFGSCGFCMLFS